MTDTATATATYSAEDCVVRPGEGQKVASGMILKVLAKEMDGYMAPPMPGFEEINTSKGRLTVPPSRTELNHRKVRLCGGTSALES